MRIHLPSSLYCSSAFPSPASVGVLFTISPSAPTPSVDIAARTSSSAAYDYFLKLYDYFLSKYDYSVP
jgi:hypothetical protein